MQSDSPLFCRILRVASQAAQEASLLNALQSIQARWASTEFLVRSLPAGSAAAGGTSRPMLVLDGFGAIHEWLEESLVILRTLQTSRCAAEHVSLSAVSIQHVAAVWSHHLM
jgi:hypothetical protein